MIIKLSPQAENRFWMDRYCVLQISLSFIQRRHLWSTRLAYGWKTRPCLKMVLTDTMLSCQWTGRFLLKKRTLLTSLLPYHNVAWEVAHYVKVIMRWHSRSSEKIWWVEEKTGSTLTPVEIQVQPFRKNPKPVFSHSHKREGGEQKTDLEF